MKTINIDQLNIRDSLPSPKGVALAILQLCRNDDISISEITKLIQTDPVLSYRLIHRANSTRQTSRVITSVHDAVFRIGITGVKQMAIGFSLIDQYSNGSCKAFDFQEFWSHSLLMAIAMEAFGNNIRIGVREELFACGLLARIGCLALATVYPQKYSEILEKQDPNFSLIEQERRYLEVDHNEMTAAMLVDAGFTMDLIEPIFYHEEPLESGFFEDSRSYQLTQQFYLAKQVADLTLKAESDSFEQTSELMLLATHIGFEPESFADILNLITQDWKAWSKLLKIPVTAFPPFQDITKTVEQYSENAASASSLRVLIVEDDEPDRNLMKKILSDISGHTVFLAADGRQGLSLALEIMPHVLITDRTIPIMDGLELTRSLRATACGKNMYIILLTTEKDEEKISEAFEVGIDDYVIKPINIRIFRARLRAAWHYRRLQESWEQNQTRLEHFAAELAISNRKLEQAALTDILTGLPNRRAGLEELTRAWSNASRSNQTVAAILIDIDHFKSINDRDGHAAGDTVLKKVSASIQCIARKGDFFCRIGGEEFLVICQGKNTDEKSTIIFAERLRQQVNSEYISISGKTVRVTISIGIALKGKTIQNESQLIKTADKALYAAKNAGRNKVFLAKQNQIIDCSASNN